MAAANDCAGDGLLDFFAARRLLLSQATPPGRDAVETLPLREAAGRVLAAPVTSRIAVPGWDNSAMDGYAVRCADVIASQAAGEALPVSQRIPAGVAPIPLAPGSAARIFTGAPLPEGADAVVVQEVCRRDGDSVVIDGQVEPGANIRRAGEDIARDARILEPGSRLGPQHLALAASVGVATLPVYRRLRVAIFASGDELVMPGEPLAPGKIYNSNLFSLRALLQRLDCEIIELGEVPDDLEATVAALARGAEQADVILSSGGVSVGEEDHVKPAVERLGELRLWRIAVRPGKPLAYGRVGHADFLGFPGNPVSLFVTFLLFARPFLQQRQGLDEVLPVILPARAAFTWDRPDRRREFQRARLTRDGEGQLAVEVFGSRSSGVMSSVAWANGLVMIPENQRIAVGDLVEFLPFDGNL